MSEYKREKLYVCQEYEIDTNGIVYSKRGKSLKPSPNHSGYMIINLMINGCRKGYAVHTLVATQFLICPSGCTQVNHKNGIKTDNQVDNLEWVTPRQNMQHSVHTLGNTYTKTHIDTSNAEKPVAGYNGAEILYFPSVRAAACYLAKVTGIKSGTGGIWKALQKGTKAGGYCWKYISIEAYKQYSGYNKNGVLYNA